MLLFGKYHYYVIILSIIINSFSSRIFILPFTFLWISDYLKDDKVTHLKSPGKPVSKLTAKNKKSIKRLIKEKSANKAQCLLSRNLLFKFFLYQFCAKFEVSGDFSQLFYLEVKISLRFKVEKI